MGLFRSIAGMICAELTSADPAGALSAINAAGIELFETVPTGDLTMTFSLYRRDWRALSALASKRGEKLRLCRRQGVYWSLKKALHRPVILTGLILLLFLCLFLPTRIYFVRVEGNTQIPARLILEQAEQCGIRFGASRRAVRSERVKNELLGAIPELQWAGVNTSGCVAIISVQDRSLAEPVEQKTGVSSIIATRDGVITEATVLQGNSLCRVGQAVKEGEVLVSGYTDQGICIQATRAQAEIYAQTNRTLTVLAQPDCLVRGKIDHTVEKFSLRIGKKQINFYQNSGILDTSCVKMYEEYPLTLPGGFTLPVCLVREQWTFYECEAAAVEQTELRETLSSFARRYLQAQMVAGQIQWQDEQIIDGRLLGEYACQEMIGREQSEEIIQSNGKDH